MQTKQSKAKEAKARWSRILEDQQRKGVSAYTYCKKARLNPNLFYTWRKRLRSENPPQGTDKGFMRVTAPEIEKQRAGVIIKTPDGYEIRIDSSTETDLIKNILVVLRDG
ncbi:MAG: hypothetical protein K8S27_01765 [Candidatus Omnitrophica bacterium]|nr:hypothetical protein [Candidatus Omnitrophota bacterium]